MHLISSIFGIDLKRSEAAQAREELLGVVQVFEIPRGSATRMEIDLVGGLKRA